MREKTREPVNDATKKTTPHAQTMKESRKNKKTNTPRQRHAQAT